MRPGNLFCSVTVHGLASLTRSVLCVRLEALLSKQPGDERLEEWQQRTGAIHRGLDGAVNKLRESESPTTLEQTEYRLNAVRVRGA